MIRVLLCDDHALIRRGMRDTLVDAGDIEVLGEVGDYGALRDQLRSGPRCDAAGLGDDHPSLDDLGDRGWDQGRLAGAGRCVDHRDSLRAKRLTESSKTCSDREVGRRG